MTRSRPAALLLLLVLIGGGAFGYGFASAKRGLFPHDLLVRIWRGRSGEPSKKTVETTFETGWFERVRGGDAATPEMLEELDKLGYSQSYQAAGAEFGVVENDAARAWPGLNLVVSAHEPSAFLMDMEGRTLHEWRFPYERVPEPEGFDPPGTFGTRYWRRARLLPGGDLLAVFDRTALIRLDKDSNLVWSLSGGYHHDLDVTADGTIYALWHDVHLVPRLHASQPIFEDFVVRITPGGEVVDRVSLLEALERSKYAPLLHNRKPEGDIFHTNALEVFEADAPSASPLWKPGRVLVSLWGIDTIAIVDLEAQEVSWALTGMWRRQHEPVLLPDGHMLVFDNLGLGERSRVIELDPLTQETTWSFSGEEGEPFFSALIGTSQRLPNGDTLIVESLAGNALEVDPAGDVVWRYRSPFRVGPNAEGVAVLMDVVRTEPSAVSDWLPLDR